MVELRSGRVALALHRLHEAPGQPVLCLHALGGSSADWTSVMTSWPGPVWALDLSGHGRSGRVRGGVYQAELLAADADAALEHVGGAALVGAGLGAYVALLLAGARADLVPAALLLPGTGLAGGGPLPAFDAIAGRPVPEGPLADCGLQAEPSTDRHVWALEHEVRPLRWAAAFAGAARSLLMPPLDGPPPPWWKAAAAEARAVTADVGQALAALAEASGR